jgi:phage tail tape-measure protein
MQFAKTWAMALSRPRTGSSETVGDAEGSIPAAVLHSASRSTGVSVGTGVSVSHGSTVGETVGSTVGETVGSTVGETVGSTVGETVGSTVGETVGETHAESNPAAPPTLVTASAAVPPRNTVQVTKAAIRRRRVDVNMREVSADTRVALED